MATTQTSERASERVSDLVSLLEALQLLQLHLLLLIGVGQVDQLTRHRLARALQLADLVLATIQSYMSALCACALTNGILHTTRAHYTQHRTAKPCIFPEIYPTQFKFRIPL